MDRQMLPSGFRTELSPSPSAAEIEAANTAGERTGAAAFRPTAETLREIEGALERNRVSWRRTEAWLSHPDERVLSALLEADSSSPWFRFRKRRSQILLAERLAQYPEVWTVLHEYLFNIHFRLRVDFPGHSPIAKQVLQRIEIRLTEITDPAEILALLEAFPGKLFGDAAARHAAVLDREIVRQLFAEGNDLHRFGLVLANPALDSSEPGLLETWLLQKFETEGGAMDLGGDACRYGGQAGRLRKRFGSLPKLTALVEDRFAKAGESDAAEERARAVSASLGFILIGDLNPTSQLEMLRRIDEVTTAHAYPYSELQDPDLWRRVFEDPTARRAQTRLLGIAQTAARNSNSNNRGLREYGQWALRMLREDTALRIAVLNHAEHSVLGGLVEIGLRGADEQEMLIGRFESLLLQPSFRTQLISKCKFPPSGARRLLRSIRSFAEPTRFTPILETLGREAQPTAWALWSEWGDKVEPDVVADWLTLPGPAYTEFRKSAARRPEYVANRRVRDALLNSPSPEILGALLPHEDGWRLRKIVRRLSNSGREAELRQVLDLPAERLAVLEPGDLMPLFVSDDPTVRERAIRIVGVWAGDRS